MKKRNIFFLCIFIFIITSTFFVGRQYSSLNKISAEESPDHDNAIPNKDEQTKYPELQKARPQSGPVKVASVTVSAGSSSKLNITA